MTANAALQHACNDLAAILANAHATLDARDLQRPRPRSGLEECTAGLCYEAVAA